MPIAAPPADVPYAYVVDYRPLDACAPPACRLPSDEVVGWWDQVQHDGGRGAYARIGGPRSELYFRRAKVLRPDAVYEFELAPGSGEYDYDGYFAALGAEGWKARFEIKASDGRVLWQQAYEGQTKQVIDAKSVAEMAHYADYFTHVRMTLPPREDRLTVRIENDGEAPLAIGSPLILKKVLGRRARQAIVVVTDAVPEPLMLRMFAGTDDEQSSWLSRTIQESGTLFTRGTSPAFNSPTFVRRFFRSGFYETDGEFALFGQGIDEQPPPTPPSPVARLVEQGFQAELTVANFMLLPTQTRLGFDGGYHNEQQTKVMLHPAALVSRFATWIGEHPHDDALNVVWFSTTHEPFRAGRAAPPFKLDAPGLKYSQRMLDDIWRNLLDAVDHMQRLTEHARDKAPDADRLWLFTTDHGRTFTERSMNQPIWLPPNFVQSFDARHCCLASFEETHTPFAVWYDGAPRVTPPRVEEPTSTVAVWRLIERAFGVDLELPNTTTFETLTLEPEADPRWDEGFLASVGDAGSIRAVSDHWAYRSLVIRPQTATLFGRPRAVQRALTGSPNRGEYFLAEELYDRSSDPYEQSNVADAHEATVLEFRRKMTDFLAIYHDPPHHPRYEYTLAFPDPVELTVSSPVEIRVGVDGEPAPTDAAFRVSLKGKRFVIEAGSEPTSVIDLEGLKPSGLLRCASTGLPLEVMSNERVRINLALARTNCVGSEAETALGPADVAFRAKLVQQSQVGSGSGMTHELLEGLRSWGYVRDLDQAHRAKQR